MIKGCGIYITFTYIYIIFSADAKLIKICKIEFFVSSVTKIMICGFFFLCLELRKYFRYITTKLCKKYYKLHWYSKSNFLHYTWMNLCSSPISLSWKLSQVNIKLALGKMYWYLAELIVILRISFLVAACNFPTERFHTTLFRSRTGMNGTRSADL